MTAGCSPRTSLPAAVPPPASGPTRVTRRTPPVATASSPAAPPHAAHAAPAPPKPAPPPVRHLGAIGTAAPTVFEAAGSDGSWVALCQARRDTNGDGHVAVDVGKRGKLSGDRMQSYLVLGDGDGEAIDELAAYDPTGRWLVVMQHGRPVLIDSRSGKRLDLGALGADARDDALPYRQHRVLSFDAGGTRLLYARRKAGKTRVVVRDLVSGAETLVDPGPGRLWRARLSPDGSQVVLRMIVDDTNKNGKLDWPVPARKNNPWRCQGPIATYPSWLSRGDEPTVKVAPSSGGSAKVVPGFADPFGRSLLVRDANGRLNLAHDSGDPEKLADDKCGARVLHADATRGLVLVACSAPRGRSPLALVGAGYHQDLKADLAAAPPDRWPAGSSRLLALYPGADTALLDLDTRKLSLLHRGDRVIATSGARALVQRGRRLVIHDVDSARERVIEGRTDRLPDARATGRFAVVAPLVVDLGAGKLLGKVSGRPLAVSSAGLVLVAQGRQARAHQLSLGPLRWVEPR